MTTVYYGGVLEKTMLLIKGEMTFKGNNIKSILWGIANKHIGSDCLLVKAINFFDIIKHR